MIDTHCHLYLDEFKDDLCQVVARAKNAGVKRIFLPAIDSQSHQEVISLESNYPSFCHAMMGLHPCSVNEHWKQEMEIVERYFTERSFAAVGECGLDFYWDKTYVDEQYQALEAQIELAHRLSLPLVLHTRNSMQEAIELLKKHKSKRLTGIFHCFSGSIEQANEIMKLGFFMGIGGVVTYKKSGLNEVLKKVPLSSLVLETDAPYLTPVPHRGKRNESGYLSFIASKIAEIKGISEAEVEEVTTANAESLFKDALSQ